MYNVDYPKKETTLSHNADEQTLAYLREIVTINAERMMLEDVEYWWTDEVLLVVFAGLIKRKLLNLPDKNFMKALEIARICDDICREAKMNCNIFILSPGGTKIHEFEETLMKANCRLLV